MKDLAILSLEFFFLILASLGKPSQSICNRICLILAIVNSEMVLRELLCPADLSGTQVLYIYKTTEVIVVRKDKNLIFAAFQVMAPSLKCLNNGKKLAVLGLVSSFCRNHFFRKECYWVPLAQIGPTDYPTRFSSRS